jgi:HEAT repeat protein
VLLDDLHPVVRARTAEGLSASDAAAKVDRLIELLDDEVPAVRFAAQQALLRAGPEAVPSLEQYLSFGNGPGIVWALEIATNLPDPRLMPPVRRHLTSPDPRRRAVATEAIVPWLEDPSILVTLLKDPNPDVRATAARAAGTAQAEQLAAHVGKLLCDSVWDVRQQAGLTLAAMGPAGLMTLRIHLDDPDPYARDMAVLMLETMAVRDPRARFQPISQLTGADAA